MASACAVSPPLAPRVVLAQQVILKYRASNVTRRTNRLRRRRAKRKALLVILLSGILIQFVQTRLPRRVWSYERSAHWWDHIALETFTEGDWLDNFRVSQATFLYICEKLKLEISKRDTRFRKAISVKRRVAITLWVLATTVEYCTVGHLFGVAQCTVCSKKHAKQLKAPVPN